MGKQPDPAFASEKYVRLCVSILRVSLPRAFSYLMVALLAVGTSIQIVNAQAAMKGSYEGALIDVHEHFTLPSGSYVGIWPSERGFIIQMDESGVASTVVFARLQYVGVLKKYADRLIPFHDFNGIVLSSDSRAVELTRQALDSGFVGIGELCFRHDRIGSAAADNPVAKQIVDLAADRGVLIVVHQSVSTPKHGPEMIPEFERILDYRKDVKFIWAHAPGDPGTISALMAKHQQLAKFGFVLSF
jgi:hypothetical protein